MYEKYTIKSIKDRLMDALVSDVQLINMLGHKNDLIKKDTDFIDVNIFDYIHNGDDNSSYTDSYIEFDVTSVPGGMSDNFRVTIIIKVHNDLIRMKSGENRADKMSMLVEEIVSDTFGKDVKNSALGNFKNYVYREISFGL